MFCKNCGKELKEGAKFCAACGAQMIDEKSVPAEDSAVESLQGQVDENVAPVETVEETPATVETSTIKEPAPKKGIAVKILVIALAVIVLLGGATLLLWNYVSAAVMHLMPTEKQLAFTYERLAYGACDTYSEYVDRADSYKDKNFESKIKLSAQASEQLMSDLSDAFGVDIDVTKAGIEIIGFGKDDSAQLNGSVSLDDEELLAVKMVVDSLKSVYIEVPQLSDSTLKLDLEDDLNMDVSEFPTEFATDLANDGKPSPKLIEKILPRLVEVAFDTIDDAKRSSETLSVGDISKKVPYIEVELSEEDLVKMALAVLEEVKENKDLKEYVYSLYDILDKHSEQLDGFDYDDADEFYEDFSDAIEDLIDELEDVDANDDDEVVWRTYVDFNYNIVGMSLASEDEDDKFSYIVLSKANKFDFEFVAIVDDDKVFEIAGDGQLEKNMISASATVSAAIDSDKLSKVAEIEISDVDVKKLDKDQLVGTLEIKAGKYVIESIPQELDINSMSIVLDFNSTELSSKNTVKFNINGKTHLTVICDVVMEETKNKVSVPYDSTTDMENWLDYTKLEEIVENIEEAGIPVMDFFYQDDYYDDYDDYDNLVVDEYYDEDYDLYY